MLISIIVPCYNEQEALPYFYKAICAEAERLRPREIELIFVDDGSMDQTAGLLRELAAKDSRIRALIFSRNFGKEAAMFAGLEHARGDYIGIMDADLQDPPELLEQMARILDGGEYDCAATRRVTRKGEPPVRSFFARCFYRLMRKISKVEIVDGARDFRLMNRKMTDAILELREYNRFSKGIFGWVGFKTKWLEYENTKRVAGETKWSFWKLFKYSFDGIAAFSTVPLAFASLLGILLCAASFLGIIFIIIRQLIFHNSAFGWASMVCIILLVSGLQLLCIGILSQYLAKTYLEVKHRPIYILKEDSFKSRSGERFINPNAERFADPGAERFENPGAERFETSGAERFANPDAEREEE